MASTNLTVKSISWTMATNTMPSSNSVEIFRVVNGKIEDKSGSIAPIGHRLSAQTQHPMPHGY
jgi:hypothetical protein